MALPNKRTRDQIPGSAGDALTAAVEHRAWLLKAHTAHDARHAPRSPHAPSAHEANGAGTREPSVAEESPEPPSPRPVLTWERPAVRDRPTGWAKIPRHAADEYAHGGFSPTSSSALLTRPMASRRARTA